MRGRKGRSGLLVVLAAVILAAGCAPQTSSVQPPLDGTAWHLQALGAPDNLRPALPNTEVTLTFTSGSEVSGNAGCNSYGGSYESGVDGTLRFADLFHTEMYCVEPGVMDQEQCFLDALSAAETYGMDESSLRIEGGGKLLVLSRA